MGSQVAAALGTGLEDVAAVYHGVDAGAGRRRLSGAAGAGMEVGLNASAPPGKDMGARVSNTTAFGALQGRCSLALLTT